MSHSGIAVAGSILVDEINTISVYPAPGELVKIESVEKAVGGCVPNVAIDLKKLVPDLPVFACGKIGDDENGRYALQALRQNGVDTSAVVSGGGRTSFTQVMSIAGGQRTFFSYAGASDDFGADDLLPDVLAPKMLHLGYFLLLKKIDEGDGLKILKQACEKGIRTSIDLVSENSDRYKQILPCLPYVDYLIVNELESGRMASMEPTVENIPAIAKKLLAAGVRQKVIIHFKEGAVCCSHSGTAFLNSFRLPDGFIQGTTGAGDAFCAGVLAGLYQNLSDDAILHLGICAATASLRTPDATGGVEEATAAARLCKNFERNELCLSI